MMTDSHAAGIVPAGALNITPDFLAAGHAIFTVANPSGEHYTFRITRAEPNEKYDRPAWFASVLTGPDNEHDYTYLGLYRPHGPAVTLSAGSKFTAESKAVRVLQWAVKVVHGLAKLPPGYKIHHEGRCGRCGHVLTTPESYERGIGPECWRKMAGGE